MKKILGVVLAVSLLSGCATGDLWNQNGFGFGTQEQQESGIESSIGKINQLDNIELGSVLLIDNLRNNLGQRELGLKATGAILQSINASNLFNVASEGRLVDAKINLGIPLQNDSLVSRNKTMGLARYVGARYVLFSRIYGTLERPVANIQLVLVNTGEIVWSDNVLLEPVKPKEWF